MTTEITRLHEAARQVSEIRVGLKLIAHTPDLPADLAKEARSLADNGVENLLWHIEERLTQARKVPE